MIFAAIQQQIRSFHGSQPWRMLFIVACVLLGSIPNPVFSAPRMTAVEKLKLTSMCSPDPAAYRVWRVRNVNPSAIEFTWDVYETDQTGSGTAVAEGDVFFNTTTVEGPNTVRLFVGGDQHDVKASQPDSCSPPTDTPQPTATFTPEPPTETPIPTAAPTVLPSYQPLSVCWVQHWNDTGSTEWRITNPNPVPLSSNPDTKVLYAWFVFDQPNAQGNIIQGVWDWDNADPNPVDTPYAQSFLLKWYLLIDGYKTAILWTVIINADETGRCAGIVPTPTPTPDTPTETPVPTATPTVLPTYQPLSVCWVQHHDGQASTEWRITNPNPVPLANDPYTVVRYAWFVFDQPDAQGNLLEGYWDWENPDPNPLISAYGQSFWLKWYLLIGEYQTEILGYRIINADESGRCAGAEPTPTTAPTETPMPTQTVTPEPTFTFTPTETLKPADTATPTFTFTPTETLEPTDTAEPTFTFTPTETLEPTDTATPTFTATSMVFETNTPIPTDTYTPTNTAVFETNTPQPTATFTPTFTHTPTASWTATATVTLTPTLTLSPTATYTFTPTSSPTPTEPPCDFEVGAGDVYGANGLVWAINAANADAGKSVICLTASTYALTTIQASSTGLPVITSEIEIQGNGAVISRNSSASAMRIIQISAAGNLTMSALTLTGGNLTNLDGGAILNTTGQLTLVDSTIHGNTARNGGGIYNSGGTVSLQNSDLYNNTAPAAGGGALVNAGTNASAMIVDTRIHTNNATTGGGIYNADGQMIVQNSAIFDNSAVTAGGLFNSDFGEITITDSVLSGNNSVSYGGGISTNGAVMTINTSCVTNNVSPIGSGIVNLDTGSVPVDARWNWWGSADGPSGDGTGLGDGIYGNVLYIPFETAPLAHCLSLGAMTIVLDQSQATSSPVFEVLALPYRLATLDAN